MPAHAESFPDNLSGGDQLLKRAQQQDVIKRVLAVLIQAVGDVALVDDETAFDAALNQRGILFDAFTGDLPGLDKALEKRAVAGAEVEDAGPLWNPVDDCVVDAGILG